MNVLILVDIQNDFVPGGRLPVPHGDEIIPLVNELQPSFDLVVATQDWHPADHKSFASNHPGKKPFEKIQLQGLEQVLWPDHCVQGSPGASFHPGLDTKKVEALFRKGMDAEIDSYSGFFDNGHKRSTGLAGYLRERGVTKVFVCGLAADYCVFYTSLDARNENFETYFIEDATRAIDDANLSKVRSELNLAGGHIIPSKKIAEFL